MSNYLFFVSYCHHDGVGPYIDKFFEDLVRLLQGRTSWDEKHIGFVDRKLQRGADWPLEIGNALRTCQVFVPLFSPRFFGSDFCGKEWTIFSDRAQDFYKKSDIKPSGRILPVFWAPGKLVTVQPNCVKSIQNREGYGSVDEEFGLQTLLDNKKYENDYKELVNELANRIARISNELYIPIKDVLPPFSNTPNAFSQYSTITNGQGSTLGPKHVKFIFIAGDQASMVGKRTKVDHYGNDPTEWKAFLPPHNEEIYKISISTILNEPFTPSWVPPDDIIDHIQVAEQKKQITVVVIDPWMLKGITNQNVLNHLDKTNYNGCLIFLVWNSNDKETTKDRLILESLVRKAFPLRCVAEDDGDVTIYFQSNIVGAQQFQSKLLESLYKVKNRIYKTLETEKLSSLPQL